MQQNPWSKNSVKMQKWRLKHQQIGILMYGKLNIIL